MYENYIRINESNIIIKSFSTAFEQPIEGDICINEEGSRHYNLPIHREDGLHNLKYIADEILPTTDEDISDEIEAHNNSEVQSTIPELQEEIEALTLLIINLQGVE